MELQQDIVFDNSEKHIGKTYIAMIEGRISGENAYMGRTYMDVPGIDSNIFIITDEELMTGDFVKVKVTGINEAQLTHYANGFRKPRPVQRQRIIDGIHQIGRELTLIG